MYTGGTLHKQAELSVHGKKGRPPSPLLVTLKMGHYRHLPNPLRVPKCLTVRKYSTHSELLHEKSTYSRVTALLCCSEPDTCHQQTCRFPRNTTGTCKECRKLSVKADTHIACRAHAVPLPCRAAKGLECVFPI
jgi:hypothetical protein